MNREWQEVVEYLDSKNDIQGQLSRTVHDKEQKVVVELDYHQICSMDQNLAESILKMAERQFQLKYEIERLINKKYSKIRQRVIEVKIKMVGFAQIVSLNDYGEYLKVIGKMEKGINRSEHLINDLLITDSEDICYYVAGYYWTCRNRECRMDRAEQYYSCEPMGLDFQPGCCECGQQMQRLGDELLQKCRIYKVQKLFKNGGKVNVIRHKLVSTTDHSQYQVGQYLQGHFTICHDSKHRNKTNQNLYLLANDVTEQDDIYGQIKDYLQNQRNKQLKEKQIEETVEDQMLKLFRKVSQFRKGYYNYDFDVLQYVYLLSLCFKVFGQKENLNIFVISDYNIANPLIQYLEQTVHFMSWPDSEQCRHSGMSKQNLLLHCQKGFLVIDDIAGFDKEDQQLLKQLMTGKTMRDGRRKDGFIVDSSLWIHAVGDTNLFDQCLDKEMRDKIDIVLNLQEWRKNKDVQVMFMMNLMRQLTIKPNLNINNRLSSFSNQYLNPNNNDDNHNDSNNNNNGDRFDKNIKILEQYFKKHSLWNTLNEFNSLVNIAIACNLFMNQQTNSVQINEIDAYMAILLKIETQENQSDQKYTIIHKLQKEILYGRVFEQDSQQQTTQTFQKAMQLLQIEINRFK